MLGGFIILKNQESTGTPDQKKDLYTPETVRDEETKQLVTTTPSPEEIENGVVFPEDDEMMMDHGGNPDATTVYTLQDVKTHNTELDCWTIIDRGVYDITDFTPQHENSPDIDRRSCGNDATSLFYSNPEHYEHGTLVYLEKYQIGIIRGSGM